MNKQYEESAKNAGFQHLHPTFGFRSIHPLMQATSPWANSRWKGVGAPNAPPLNLAPWNSAVINGLATWENNLELSVSIYKSRIFPCLITGYISEIAARQQLTSSRFSLIVRSDDIECVLTASSHTYCFFNCCATARHGLRHIAVPCQTCRSKHGGNTTIPPMLQAPNISHHA